MAITGSGQLMSCHQGRPSVSNGRRTRFVTHRSCKRRDKRDCWLVFFKEVEYIYLFPFFLSFFLSGKCNTYNTCVSLFFLSLKYIVRVRTYDIFTRIYVNIYINEIVLKIFVDEFQLCMYSWNLFFLKILFSFLFCKFISVESGLSRITLQAINQV